MRPLAARMVVGLATSAFVALVVAEVAFLFWATRRFEGEARLELEAALLELVQDPAIESDPTPVLARVAAAHGVVLTLGSDDGRRVASAPVDLPPLPVVGAVVDHGAYLHAGARLEAGPWRWAVASRARAAVLDDALASGRRALGVLAASAALAVALGIAFHRRAVLRPLGRLTGVVEAQELDALGRFAEPGAGDDLSRLGRAIVALSQRLDEDRARIAAQLEELGTKNRELADAQRELLRSERLAVVGQLAAGLAHEIGNPLAILSGFVDMLAKGSLGETERAEALGRMGKELARIHGTLRSLLDFARAPSPAAPDAAEGDLARVLDHVRSLMTPQLRGATLDLPALAPPLPVALGDDALTQLLLNLLLNALEAAGSGGRIAVVVDPLADGVRTLHVDDSGPGVPPELRARVFEPFFTTKPAGRGTGLGLSICERIVAAAGGDLRIGDGPLGGARFTVTLPLPRGAARSVSRGGVRRS